MLKWNEKIKYENITDFTHQIQPIIVTGTIFIKRRSQFLLNTKIICN